MQRGSRQPPSPRPGKTGKKGSGQGEDAYAIPMRLLDKQRSNTIGGRPGSKVKPPEDADIHVTVAGSLGPVSNAVVETVLGGDNDSTEVVETNALDVLSGSPELPPRTPESQVLLESDDREEEQDQGSEAPVQTDEGSGRAKHKPASHKLQTSKGGGKQSNPVLRSLAASDEARAKSNSLPERRKQLMVPSGSVIKTTPDSNRKPNTLSTKGEAGAREPSPNRLQLPGLTGRRPMFDSPTTEKRGQAGSESPAPLPDPSKSPLLRKRLLSQESQESNLDSSLSDSEPKSSKNYTADQSQQVSDDVLDKDTDDDEDDDNRAKNLQDQASTGRSIVSF